MSNDNDLISSNYAQVGDLKIHYLAAGEGEPAILLHGWPTCSYLWRNIIAPLSKTNRVIAPDLAGFGKSDKPLHAVYTLTFLSDVFGDFLKALNIEKAAIVLHDVGVSVGLLWVIRNVQKVEKLAITDSVIYPDGYARLYFTYNISLFKRVLMTVPYPGVPLFLKLILLAVRIVGLRKLLFSAWPGVYMTMKLGVKNKKRMTKEVIQEYMAPFKNEYGSRILTKTFLEGDLSELEEIVEKLPVLTMPVHIIYGEDDWLTPQRTEEFRRLQQDLPNARLTAVPDCGHYLQEDQSEKVSQLLVEFLAE